jgi:hypothetical protein
MNKGKVVIENAFGSFKESMVDIETLQLQS